MEEFYLTMHSTHFIYGYVALLYGKGPFRKQERKPAITLNVHVLISIKGIFICTIQQTAQYIPQPLLIQ